MRPRWAIILVLVPILLWVLHLAWVLPELARRSGCDNMIFGIWFFFVSGAIMILCELTSIITFAVTRRRWLIWAIVLNLTWLYYLKVMFFGPTLGDF